MSSRTRTAILYAGAACAAFAAALVRGTEWDTFFHLAYGRELVGGRAFPAEDPFLYPLAGLPAGTQPGWLGSLAVYASWLLAGEAGPSLLVALVAAGLFVLLLRDALDGRSSGLAVVTAALPLSLALAVLRARASARPELFAYLLLAGTLVALSRHVAGRSTPLALFPAAAVLWGNLHQSLLAGIAVLAAFVLVNGAVLVLRRAWPGAPAEAEVTGPRGLALPALAAAGGLVAAALLTPGGLAQLRTAAEFVREVIAPASTPVAGTAPLAALAATVDELRAPTAQHWLGPFGWLAALTGVSLLLSGRKANLREAATCAAFVALAAGATRFMAMAGIVLAPVAARHLRRAVEAAPGRLAFAARAAAVALGITGSALASWRMAHLPGIELGTGWGRQFPARAVEYLRALEPRGRVFNTFHFGGYLAWSLQRKVFQDGRGLLLPADAAAALAGPSAYARFATLDARYRFDALVVHYPQFAGAAFARRSALPPGSDWGADRRTWALVAFDDGGQVYLRRDGAYAAEAARDEYRWAMPANSLALPQWGDRDALRTELLRSLREAPDCMRCRTMLGFLIFDGGAPVEAEPLLAVAASEGLPETRLYALLGLARAAEERRDLRAAEATWREIVTSAPDPAWSRRQLAALLLEEGRADDAWSEIEENLGNDDATREDLALAWRIASARQDAEASRELAARLARARPGGH